MSSRIQTPRQYRKHIPARTKAVEVKGAVWYGLALVAVISALIYSVALNVSNAQYVKLGQSVDCVERPSFEYFNFCSPVADGVACSYASQTRMMAFYDPIDQACASFEPKRVFRFPVSQPDQFAEAAN